MKRLLKLLPLLLTAASIFVIVMLAGGFQSAPKIASALKKLGSFTGLGMTGGLFVVATVPVAVHAVLFAIDKHKRSE